MKSEFVAGEKNCHLPLIATEDNGKSYAEIPAGRLIVKKCRTVFRRVQVMPP